MEAILAAMTSQGGKITLSAEQLQQLIGAMSSQQTPEKKTARKTSTKDPHAPTRAKTPYMFWLWDPEHGVAAVKAAHDEEAEGKLVHKNALKLAAQKWKTMSDEEKEPWNSKSAEDRERYEQEKASYTPSAPIQVAAHPAPEGWSGPFSDRFIRGYPKDADGLIVEAGKRVSKKYQTFEEALADAQKLGSACTGITRNKRGLFTLRGGKDLLSSTVAEISWTNTPPAPLLLANTVPTSQPVSREPTPEPQHNVDPLPQGDGCEEPPGSAQDDDSEDDDEIDATEIEHEGETYYLDENDNKIYNAECEHIANMIDGTFTLI